MPGHDLNASEPVQLKTPTLSVKGDELVNRAKSWDRFVSLLVNQYSEDRPHGFINFGVAENSLMHDVLKDYFPRNFKLDDLDFSYGDHLIGTNRLSTSLANFFNKKFNPLVPVEADHVVTGNGLTTVLEQMTTILCDPGDAFLIARPYYNGFDDDLTVRAKANVVGVDVGPDPSSPSTLDAFEHQLSILAQSGTKARAIMLCNPNNPLGFNYPRETLLAYARLAEKHNLHLVSDEIYALSQFRNPDVDEEKAVRFTSMLNVDVLKEAGCNPARVCVLYGVAKDFGANGLRIGCLVTQHNRALYNAFMGMGLQMKVSSVSDTLWSALLNDEHALDAFIVKNQERLTQAFATCRDFFRKHDIPYLGQPVAALFFWIDLSRFHREKDDDGKVLETDFDKDEDIRKVLARGGVFIGPGHIFHGTSPGWFRFTFSVRPDFLQIGLQRFEAAIEQWTASAQK